METENLTELIESEAQKDLRLWERQPYENDRMYGAFRYYSNLSPVQRSLRAAYGSQGNGTGRENAARECIWFSPHCLIDQLPLFAQDNELS